VAAKVISFDEGEKPTEKQDQVFKGENEVETLPVTLWEDLTATKERRSHGICKGAAMAGVQLLQANFSPAMAGYNLHIERDGSKHKVVAGKYMTRGSLVLPVPLDNPNGLAVIDETKTKHPYGVWVKVKEANPEAQGLPFPAFVSEHKYLITPEFKLPKKPERDGTDYEWTDKERAHPFWAITRSDDIEKINCELTSSRVQMVVALDGPPRRPAASRTLVCTVPVIHNIRPMKVNDAVVLKWEMKEKKVHEKKAQTWQTDAINIIAAAKGVKRKAVAE
jgi:hypothetical protein